MRSREAIPMPNTRPREDHMRGASWRVPGFTLLELVVVMAILSALALAALPLVGGVDDARNKRALMDCQAVANALRSYMHDTRLRPTGRQGRPDIRILTGRVGTAPALPASLRGKTTLLDVLTARNTWHNPRWRGPYLEHLGPDPWGHRYLVLALNFHRNQPVWVLSAGPDGVIQTTPNSQTPEGDDIGTTVE